MTKKVVFPPTVMEFPKVQARYAAVYSVCVAKPLLRKLLGASSPHGSSTVPLPAGTRPELVGCTRVTI